MTQPTPAEPRWLDDHEQATWRAYLATVSLLDDALDQQLRRDAGIPHAYYMLLAMLSEAPGRSLRMSELAAVTQSSQSRVSHAVSRLEDLGWVRRDPAPTDRRGSVAVLTDEGFTVLAEAAPGHVEAVRTGLFDPLSREQVRQLRDICETVLGHLDPGRLAPLRRDRTPGPEAGVQD